MSEQYHKIPNVFKREEKNKKYIDLNNWYTPELELLSSIPFWYSTEKIDGTNIRVIWDGNRVEFKGKTDNAQLPPRLVSHLNSLFEYGEEQFEEEWGETPVTFYGEGFGSKIQNGGDYFPDSEEGQNEFALFDVRIEGVWLDYESVNDIAWKFGLEKAPIIHNREKLDTIVDLVNESAKVNYIPTSTFGNKKPIEGYVIKTDPQLLDKRGKRIIAKVKYEDFTKLKERNNENGK